MVLQFIFCLALGLLTAPNAFAQNESGSVWLNADYTYSEMDYKQADMTEKGRFPGVRGDIGLALFSFVGFSAGGAYQDGNLNYDGATLSGTALKNTVTSGYLRDLRALAHLFYGPIILSGGIGQREWFDHLPNSYRRRNTYDYTPLAITLFRDSVYIKAELDIWRGGKSRVYLSDLGGGEKDVELKQSEGTGYGAEVGVLIPNPLFKTRIFAAYHRWNIKDSETLSDGVRNITEPKSTTITISGGIGIGF